MRSGRSINIFSNNRKTVFLSFKRGFILFILTLLLLLLYTKENYVFNLSPSMTTGVYKKIKVDTISKNDIVMIKIPEVAKGYIYERGYIEPNVTSLLKRVKAIENDSIEIRDRKLYINNEMSKNLSVLDSKGLTLPYKEYTKTLKNNEYFLLGDNRDKSFDSAYFGSVHREDIIYKAKLVLEI